MTEFVAQTRASSDIRFDFEVLPAQMRDEANLTLDFAAQRSGKSGVGVEYEAINHANFSIAFKSILTGESLLHIRFEAVPRRKRRPKVVDSGPDVGVYVFSESK